MATESDNDVQAVKRERKVTRSLFTKNAHVLEELLSVHDGREPSIELAAQYLKMQELQKQLTELDKEVRELIRDFDEVMLEREMEGAMEYRSRWIILDVKYKNRFERNTTVEKKGGKETRKFKLPTLQFITFDGDLKGWLPFWGQFEKIDKDPDIDAHDKYQYLLQAMKDGSEPKRLVQSFTPTSYRECLNQLKDRYAREELLIQVYVRELLRMINNIENTNITTVYDKISALLRALETLGVTKDRFSAFLLPMVESALPQELLKVWERNKTKNEDISVELNNLLTFLRKEVESEQRISLAKKTFDKLENNTDSKPEPTAGCLLTLNTKDNTSTTLVGGVSKVQKKIVCLWCDKEHPSAECYKLSKMNLNQRREHIKKKNACMQCLKPGHHAKVCKAYVQCFICTRKHSAMLCPGQATNNREKESTTSKTTSNLSSQGGSITLLQTVMVKLVNGDKQVTVRALVDNGSQRSYVKKEVAQKLGLQSVNKEVLTHNLFSGVEVRSKEHKVYNISAQSCDLSYKLDMAVLEQTTICNNLPRYNENKSDVTVKNLMMKHGIMLTDTDKENAEISLLIGADYSGHIMTNIMILLNEGLFAIKTKLGWVLQGKVNNSKSNTTNTLFCSSDVTGFWSVELLGIRDPIESKTKVQEEADAVMSFEDSVAVNAERRYEVVLPLKVGYEDLQSNRGIAEKRLVSTTRRLVSSGKFTEYNSIINNWESEGIVEKVPDIDINHSAHYLPHRGIVKDTSLTTKLRPVYDASACDKNGRSLNSYLNKGVNLLDKIPHLLTGFRKGAIGISADIAKAFLQVSVRPSDRDYLRFLWWKDESQTELVEYRHRRVVFGLTSSPFLLSATISHHLNQIKGKEKDTANILAKSFYVDNCLTSLDTEQETCKFIKEAKEVMKQGKFDLRQWVTSPKKINETGSNVISILGLLWHTETDELSCNLDNLPPYSTLGQITKKDLMSLIQRIFDPVGFTCAATLTPRLIMQETWRRGLTWEENLPYDLETEFRKWYKHITCLKDCKIPRRLTNDLISECRLSLHLFCDASKDAYGACVLLRSEKDDKVNVQMFSAKSRVAPPGKASIPRLELTAALIGSRLLAEARKSLNVEGIKEYCWTDSCVAYYWITKNLPWNTYVHNRVKEIRENSDASNWFHISGNLNWSDVASRGCNAEQLLLLRWWEGPAWLRLSAEEWPKSTIRFDDTEACKELKKIKTACNADICTKEGIDMLCYFSKYTKIVRMMAWIQRFKYNMLSKNHKKTGEITANEYEDAEKKIIKLIQSTDKEYLEQKGSLNTHQDEEGFIRVRTKLLLSDFPESTKSPMLLPAKNIIVKRLVEQRHRQLHHAGANQLIADLRARFWIVGIRRLTKSVIASCTVCTRFRAKSVQAPTAPLPSDRIQCTAPFQVSGADLAGPMFLRNGDKCWAVIFTCAVYRCVHIELTKSLSTDAFMLVLRRFIARRGRVTQIISDNGGNLVGTKNRLSEIDWDEIQKRSAIERIKWKMNAPTAAWWGGFFERLIRIMKELLRRILGQSRVDYEELETILYECEAVMNQRPLTYVQDDKNTNLEPLTPSCFIQSIPNNDTTDLDAADEMKLNSRLKYLLKLREDFKQRFKTEYLTALVQRGKEKQTKLKIGDIVLIETEEKRVKWPLGVVTEIYIGKDGIYRTAKVRTSLGDKVRPFQRLYPLEVSCEDLNSELQNSSQGLTGHLEERWRMENNSKKMKLVRQKWRLRKQLGVGGLFEFLVSITCNYLTCYLCSQETKVSSNSTDQFCNMFINSYKF